MKLSSKIYQLYKLATYKALLSPTKGEERLLRTGIVSIKSFVSDRPWRLVGGIIGYPFSAPAMYLLATCKLPSLIAEHRREQRQTENIAFRQQIASNILELAARTKPASTAIIIKKMQGLMINCHIPKSPTRQYAPSSPKEVKAMWESVYSPIPQGQEAPQFTC
jgi:hypothetical protein